MAPSWQAKSTEGKTNPEDFPGTLSAGTRSSSTSSSAMQSQRAREGALGPPYEQVAIIKEKEESIVNLSSALKLKEKEMGELKKQIQELQSQVKDARELKVEVDTMGKLLKEAEEVKRNYGFEMFAQGFRRAVSQIRELEPNLKVDAMDITKVVPKGALDDDFIAEMEQESATLIEKKD
ncbi:hypothetical protein PIB30_016985 [Stylosanthes scabra]|uniref:Uncharacterized protein n=1 Tax=Stylosanthes scabra TaxID=79078 RepID=A0ABU6Z6I1_9FABA|nr:hypothetical protein [Stylosanthes scabra]